MTRLTWLFFLAMFPAALNAVAQSRETLWKRDSVQLLAELRKMVQQDQEARSSSTKSVEDWKLVEQADAMRTRRMIEIIRTYGFPSLRRFKSRRGEFLVPYILLVHSPKEYFATLRPILKAEKEAGRISPDEYAHIEWHLNGRVGSPAFE